MIVLGGKCEPVIVFECVDLSIGQRVNVSGLSCVSNKVLRCWDSSRSYVTLYIIKSLLFIHGNPSRVPAFLTGMNLSIPCSSPVENLSHMLCTVEEARSDCLSST